MKDKQLTEVKTWNRPPSGSTLYNGLYHPIQGGTFPGLQENKRVEISQVQVYERVREIFHLGIYRAFH